MPPNNDHPYFLYTLATNNRDLCYVKKDDLTSNANARVLGVTVDRVIDSSFGEILAGDRLSSLVLRKYDTFGMLLSELTYYDVCVTSHAHGQDKHLFVFGYARNSQMMIP